MSTISINELKQQPDEIWLKSTEKEDMIVTSQGQSVAVLLPADAESLEHTLATLRSVRAMIALAALQTAAEANGTGDLSVEEIDSEIKAARQARQRSAMLESFYDESKNLVKFTTRDTHILISFIGSDAIARFGNHRYAIAWRYSPVYVDAFEIGLEV